VFEEQRDEAARTGPQVRRQAARPAGRLDCNPTARKKRLPVADAGAAGALHNAQRSRADCWQGRQLAEINCGRRIDFAYLQPERQPTTCSQG